MSGIALHGKFVTADGIQGKLSAGGMAMCDVIDLSNIAKVRTMFIQ